MQAKPCTEGGDDECSKLLYANVTSLTNKVWKYVSANVKAYDHWALIETHVHKESEIKKWDKAARALNLRMTMNSARRSSKAVSKAKEAVANEGGEVFPASTFRYNRYLKQEQRRST